MALIIREKEGEGKRFADVILKVAGLHLSLGKVAEGEVLLQRAALIYQEKLGGNSVSDGKALEELGNLYFEQKIYEKAQVFLEKAYAIQHNQKDHSVLSKKGMKNLITIYKEKGEKRKYFQVKLRKKIN